MIDDVKSMSRFARFIFCPTLALAAVGGFAQQTAGNPDPAFANPWPRHVIDDSSRGSDGARFSDVNGDGLPDVSVPWEEGGVVRLYLHPGAAAVREPWPSVTVGSVASPEDAVIVDLDGDGYPDVVSSCEGVNRTIFVHWNPGDPARLLDPQAWITLPIPATHRVQQWMFCLPFDVDGRGGTDLVAGGKGTGASIGWLQSPLDPRDLAAWKFHPIHSVGWIMSILADDVDGDGHQDIVYSDRRGDASGIYWLPRVLPRRGAADSFGSTDPDPIRGRWDRRLIGGLGREVMFIEFADLDGDGFKDVLASAIGGDIIHMKAASRNGSAWAERSIPRPGIGIRGKSIRVGDLDGDGRMDLVHSFEGAQGFPGVVWMRESKDNVEAAWETFDISGNAGVKFDLVQLMDLDLDGDLDVVTCEERDGLGVVWYENPRGRIR